MSGQSSLPCADGANLSCDAGHPRLRALTRLIPVGQVEGAGGVGTAPQAPPLSVGRAAGVPVAPGNVGEGLVVGRERAAGLSLICCDDLFGIPDLPFQLGYRSLRLVDRLRAGNLPKGKSGSLEMFQGLTVFFDLGPMPRDLAVTVCDHVSLLKSVPKHK